MKIRRTFGFTLAEVLITLGIIGVVAAMTMPALVQNQQKRSLEVATQKFYSMMSQAVKQYMADYGIDDLRNSPLASDNYGDDYDENGDHIPANGAIESIRDFMTKYLKVVKECDHDANDCFAPEYKAWDGSDGYGNFKTLTSYDDYRDYVLADGSIIRIGYYLTENPIELYVDINGKKGPNRIGYDLWSMSIFYDGSIDECELKPECKRDNECPYAYSPSETRAWRFENCQNGAYGGCFGHFLENGFKFDY